jgi:hypothetical protein
MDNKWELRLVYMNGDTRTTRFKDMDLESAEQLADNLVYSNDPNGLYRAVRVVGQETGKVISEWEW